MKGSWPWNKDYSKQKQGVLYLGVHLFFYALMPHLVTH